MSNFLTQILGTTDVASFAASIFFAFVGVLLSLLFHANTRDPNSPQSPIPFSWSFLLNDNTKRLLIGIISVFIALRFSNELLGTRLTLFFSFVIGVSFDNLGKIIQNKVLNK